MNRYISFATLLILIVFLALGCTGGGLALGCTGGGAEQTPANKQGQEEQGQEELVQKEPVQEEPVQPQYQMGQEQGEIDQPQYQLGQEPLNVTGGGLSGTYGCLSFSDGLVDPSSGVPTSGVPIRFTVRPDGTWTDITFGEAEALEGEYTVNSDTAQFLSAQGNPLYNFQILEGGARLLDDTNRQNCRK